MPRRRIAALLTSLALGTSALVLQAAPTASAAGFVVSEAQFNQMFPNRNSFYTYSGLTAALGAYPAFANTGSDTVKKQEAAAFLANYWNTQSGPGSMTPHNAMVNGAGFGQTIRSINGSLECDGKNPAQVQSRVSAYQRFAQVLGVSPGAGLYC